MVGNNVDPPTVTQDNLHPTTDTTTNCTPTKRTSLHCTHLCRLSQPNHPQALVQQTLNKVVHSSVGVTTGKDGAHGSPASRVLLGSLDKHLQENTRGGPLIMSEGRGVREWGTAHHHSTLQPQLPLHHCHHHHANDSIVRCQKY